MCKWLTSSMSLRDLSSWWTPVERHHPAFDHFNVPLPSNRPLQFTNHLGSCCTIPTGFCSQRETFIYVGDNLRLVVPHELCDKGTHTSQLDSSALDGQSCGCNQIWLYAFIWQSDRLMYQFSCLMCILWQQRFPHHGPPGTPRDPSLPGCRPTSLVMGTRHHFVARQQAQNHHTV